MLRGKAKVCGFSDGLIPWPLIRVGHGGKGAYVMTRELARAVRHESNATIVHWWGVVVQTVSGWRRALGVASFNEGTRRLYSLWKGPKLPDNGVVFSKAALRRHRLEKKLSQAQVAKLMGWNSPNGYAQMESGERRRATPQTLHCLAGVLGCKVRDLLHKRSRKNFPRRLSNH
jgi:hypothetical protein